LLEAIHVAYHEGQPVRISNPLANER